MAQYKRPNIIRDLKLIYKKAGCLSVHNAVKQGKNKIMLACRSEQHGQEIIEKLINAKPFEIIFY